MSVRRQSRSKLKPAIKKRWVAALRSGRYKQTRNHLFDRKGGKPGYCCLGVLAHEEFDGWWKPDPWLKKEWLLEGWDDGDDPNEDDVSDWDGDLPANWSSKIGLPQAVQAALVRCNDEGRLSFKQIADVIQKTL